jgi:hypothetical protein
MPVSASSASGALLMGGRSNRVARSRSRGITRSRQRRIAVMSPSRGLVDRQADDGLGLALEHGLGQNGGLVARARRPAGRISALTFFEPHLIVSWLRIQTRSWRCIVHKKTRCGFPPGRKTPVSIS